MKPRIVVCVKSVMLHAPAGKVVRTADTCELNPFDRPALAAARFLKSAIDAQVVALSMGPPSAAAALYEAIALGADQGVLLSDPCFAGSDTLATATVLAAAVRRLAPVGWLVFGTRTADSDTGQVGPQTAVLLELPMVAGVIAIDPAPVASAAGEIKLQVDRVADGFTETFMVKGPAALSIASRAFDSAHLGLTQVGVAFEEGHVETWGIDDLALDADQVGDAGSPTRVVSLTRQSQDRTCEFLTGGPDNIADELVHRLVDSGRLE